MAKKRISSRPGLFGFVYHYDENGNCIGKSRPSLMGDGKVHYDTTCRKVGTSRPGFLAKEVYNDSENEQCITSYEGLTGDVHFSTGTPMGVSYQGFGEVKYTILDVDDEESCDEEERLEEEDAYKLSDDEDNNQKTVITNIIVFVACCLIVGILVLIFK